MKYNYIDERLLKYIPKKDATILENNLKGVV